MKRLVLALLPLAAQAQCVMCFRSAAAQQAERARVFNEGILVLGIPPLLILAFFLVLAWRRRRTWQNGSNAPS
ncbi:MAG: hypothetical protein IPM24_07450 [Bryobacterales bacterium]|nr:hypothetical protein [Bryobacterales bacterium]